MGLVVYPLNNEKALFSEVNEEEEQLKIIFEFIPTSRQRSPGFLEIQELVDFILYYKSEIESV